MPSARTGHSGVSWRGKLVIFGGQLGFDDPAGRGRTLNDTWIMDVSDPGGAVQVVSTKNRIESAPGFSA